MIHNMDHIRVIKIININVNSNSFQLMNFINQFVDEQFYQNRMDMATLHATMVKATAPTNYYVKRYKSDLSVLCDITNMLNTSKKKHTKVSYKNYPVTTVMSIMCC